MPASAYRNLTAEFIELFDQEIQKIQPVQETEILDSKS
jgi:hypothetical protein